MRIDKVYVIKNVHTGHYFMTYSADGMPKCSWSTLVHFSNMYNTIGGVNHAVKKNMEFFKDTLFEIKELKRVQ